MYAPIFFPTAPKPSPAVLAAERAILDAEGPSHVEGWYIRDPMLCERQRRLVAERRVRDAERAAAREAALDRNRREAAEAIVHAGERDGERPRPADRAPLATCATWLTPRERVRVEAAKTDDLVVRHHETVSALRDDLAQGMADAVLVSAARVQPADVGAIAALVHGFPGVPVVALVDDVDRANDAHALAAALLFGRAGVRSVVDTRAPHGWCAFRSILNAEQLPDTFRRRAVASVLAEIAGSERTVADLPAGCARFFALVFAPRTTSAKAVAADLGVHPTTLCSRFIRAGLPSPKRYATTARLVLAAHFAERPGVRFGDLARQLGASSAQSLGRTIRAATGLRASAFRDTFDGDVMLRRFLSSLVTPYRDRLRTFDPAGANARNVGAPVSEPAHQPNAGGADVRDESLGRAA